MVNGASGYNIEIVPPSGNYSGYSFGNELSWPANTPITSSVLQVTFTTPVTAVSVDLMTSGGSGVGYTAMFYNSDSSLFALNTDTTQGWPAQTFFGLTSDTPFSMIDFYLPASSMGVTPLIDNFSYSTSLAQAPVDPSDTPELGTFLLIASGLIGMALMGRRLRRDVAQVS